MQQLLGSGGFSSSVSSLQDKKVRLCGSSVYVLRPSPLFLFLQSQKAKKDKKEPKEASPEVKKSKKDKKKVGAADVARLASGAHSIFCRSTRRVARCVAGSTGKTKPPSLFFFSQ